ncbi:hypothetical protein [Nocardia sp. NBC_00511]|uniref:hypothetical protein n=1 Tax=Nocardia sp. NBC_00511 TaxID=2903591 RepID=UPI0030DE3AF7
MTGGATVGVTGTTGGRAEVDGGGTVVPPGVEDAAVVVVAGVEDGLEVDEVLEHAPIRLADAITPTIDTATREPRERVFTDMIPPAG